VSPAYILKRFLLIGYTLFVVSLIVFAITQILPADAAVMMLGENATPDALAALIKAAPLRLDAPMPIARAISTAGGIVSDEVDAGFMLKRLPGVFAAGEMLDWEAPTGGYLLQASFATGTAAAAGIDAWLARG